jgi:hypothetical protein
MPGQKTHGFHVIFAAMTALVTGPRRLARKSNRKRIALFTVRALGDGARAKPGSASQQHEHSSGQ